MKTTTDALAMLNDLIGDDAELREMIAEESSKIDIAALIYRAREAAGLTQKQLAVRAGTTQPVIARMENADYDGHSLSMLRRIGNALDLVVEIKLVPRQTGNYRPEYVEETATVKIRFSTHKSHINTAAYSSARWPGTTGHDYSNSQVG